MVVEVGIAQSEIIPLYPEHQLKFKNDPNLKEKDISEKADGIIRLRNVTNPTIEIFRPKDKTSDAAVLILPGGGYYILAYDHEGTRIAQEFNKNGITAIVLKYRLPQKELFDNPSEVSLMDSYSAMSYIKSNAEKWGINPEKIGIMGFSAGGHLSTLVSNGVPSGFEASKIIKPKFNILVYPVTTFTKGYALESCYKNLLGETATIENRKQFSSELLVDANTCPTFLVHAGDDEVSHLNSVEYYLALKKNGVKAELHVYEKGGHGFGLNKTGFPVDDWFLMMLNWMKASGYM
ncbi:MAG: alpha/beta hydrolase [Leadbetterella sp.]